MMKINTTQPPQTIGAFNQPSSLFGQPTQYSTAASYSQPGAFAQPGGFGQSGPVSLGGGFGTAAPTGTGLYSQTATGNGITPVQPAAVPSAPTYNPPT